MTERKPFPEIDRLNRRGVLRLTAGGMMILPFASSIAACSGAQSPASEPIPPHIQLVTQVSELIIPQTDTPGAIAAGVPAYIAKVLTDWFSAEDSEAMIASWAAFDEAAVEQGAADFLTASEAQKVAAMTAMEASDSAIFEDLKQLVVFAYYTSEAATEELNYDPVPGEFRACLPLDEAGPAAMLYGH
ncbi:MAG: gluconate 2-dehydrogenase subunit 3 family protein [Henriciella sp.]|nr:gluconate 2-dehydrogenase subunit 3 family protein [Henriciella sp.]